MTICDWHGLHDGTSQNWSCPEGPLPESYWYWEVGHPKAHGYSAA